MWIFLKRVFIKKLFVINFSNFLIRRLFVSKMCISFILDFYNSVHFLAFKKYTIYFLGFFHAYRHTTVIFFPTSCLCISILPFTTKETNKMNSSLSSNNYWCYNHQINSKLLFIIYFLHTILSETIKKQSRRYGNPRDRAVLRE